MNDFKISGHKMPAVFVGHGNPMYAIEENEFADGWRKLGAALPRPEAVLCISAHWESQGTFVTAMEEPKTIHDFYGFPKELFKAEYPAKGSPLLAELIIGTVKSAIVSPDYNWGLDHGCWSVLKHVYPNADIPVVQLSIDRSKPSQWHYELGKELGELRNKGVLIIGSGNIVHNLRLADWHNKDSGFDWALEINQKFKKLIAEGNHKELINYNSLGYEANLAIPTAEHYLPLLYILGMKEKEETLSFFNDKVVMGSLSMTSLIIGKE
jgi:4,5-DOPA dioxygenase extradiol